MVERPLPAAGHVAARLKTGFLAADATSRARQNLCDIPAFTAATPAAGSDDLRCLATT